MSSRNLRAVIQSFHYEDDQPKVVAKVVKKQASPRKPKLEKPKPQYSSLKDLPPMISDDLTLLFVGFNPGVESSKQQHHYAHPTNLFWKLFNALDVLLRVLLHRNLKVQDHQLLRDHLYTNDSLKASAQDDQDLVQFGIGFTDLVLRCTKTAQELSKQEKLDNVPRLFSEFASTNASHIVVIGKGIWEFIVKYMDPKHKLTKDNFTWGLQAGPMIDRLHNLSGSTAQIYVFPNTSGLVALMKYPEKLALWQELAASIVDSKSDIYKDPSMLVP